MRSSWTIRASVVGSPKASSAGMSSARCSAAARRLDVRVGAEARERPGRVEDPSARSRRCSVDHIARDVSERRDRAHAGAAPAVTRRATSATTLAIANETRKLGTVAPMLQSGGFSLPT